MLNECSCNGSGMIEKGGKLYECVCSLLKRRAMSMPPYIRTAELRYDHTKYKIHENIHKSIFILATWTDMKSIIKATMIKYMNLFVRITSDNEILHAYVGAMSKKNKSDNEATFETVSDFIGPPSLVIVRLNAITRPNKAAAGALEEAMVCRMDQDKSTWFISDINRPFTSSSPAYSESVWDLMEAFIKIKVPPILPKNLPQNFFDVEVLNSESETVASQPKVSMSKPKKSKEVVKKSEDEIIKKSEDEIVKKSEDEIDIDALSMYGGGLKKKSNFNRGE